MGPLHEQQQLDAQQYRIQVLRELERRLAEDPHVRATVLAAVRDLLMEAEAEARPRP
jgi:hypothetical protein